MLYDEIKTPSNVRMFYESREAQTRYFFSRETMRFFGDTMRSFGVKRIDGMVYLYRKPSASVNVFGNWRRADSDNNFLGIWRLDPDTYDLRSCKEHHIAQWIYGRTIS